MSYSNLVITDQFGNTVASWVQIPITKQPTWHPKTGFGVIAMGGRIPLGTYHFNGVKWRLRCKKFKGGHTWKLVDANAPMIKKIKVEALIQGVNLNGN